MCIELDVKVFLAVLPQLLRRHIGFQLRWLRHRHLQLVEPFRVYRGPGALGAGAEVKFHIQGADLKVVVRLFEHVDSIAENFIQINPRLDGGSVGVFLLAQKLFLLVHLEARRFERADQRVGALDPLAGHSRILELFLKIFVSPSATQRVAELHLNVHCLKLDIVFE